MGLHIVDVSQPAEPKRVGGFNGSATGVAASENFVFLAEEERTAALPFSMFDTPPKPWAAVTGLTLVTSPFRATLPT
jgi:hypothetical protein